jgi:hypothetical protein
MKEGIEKLSEPRFVFLGAFQQNAVGSGVEPLNGFVRLILHSGNSVELGAGCRSTSGYIKVLLVFLGKRMEFIKVEQVEPMKCVRKCERFPVE